MRSLILICLLAALTAAEQPHCLAQQVHQYVNGTRTTLPLMLDARPLLDARDRCIVRNPADTMISCELGPEQQLGDLRLYELSVIMESCHDSGILTCHDRYLVVVTPSAGVAVSFISRIHSGEVPAVRENPQVTELDLPVEEVMTYP